MRFLICLLALSLTLSLPLAAAAQQPQYTINLFGLTALYAPPPWTTTADRLEEEVEISRQQGQSAQGTDVFIFEFIPGGESFDNWSELYAIYAETPVAGSAADHMNGQFARAQAACDGAHLQSSDTTPPNVALFIQYCPRYRNNPGIGEVMFMNLQMVGNTQVRSYYHVRVPAYELPNVPLSTEAMTMMMGRVAALQLQ